MVEEGIDDERVEDGDEVKVKVVDERTVVVEEDEEGVVDEKAGDDDVVETVADESIKEGRFEEGILDV